MTEERAGTAEVAAEGGVEFGLAVNGIVHQVAVPADEALVVTLRESLGLRSVRETCGIGVCGSCTVLIDGEVASSCDLLTVQVRHNEITTADGLPGEDGSLSLVQQAFLRNSAYQCSFCTPAMTLAVHAALADPEIASDRTRIREYLAGNLCRCGTYPEIMDAIDDLLEQHP